MYLDGRGGGLVVSALDSGVSGSGSSAGLGHSVVFLGKTLFTLTVPLFTQVYNCVRAHCWGNLTNCREVTCDGLASRPGEVEILLAASCYRNWDSSSSYEPVLAPRLHYHFHMDLDTNHRKI